MSTTTRRAPRAHKASALPFSATAAKLIEQIQAEARAKLLEDLSAKDDVVLLLEHANKAVEFDDYRSAYYIHTPSNSYAISLYRGRPDASDKHPHQDGVWWGSESRLDSHGVEWSRRMGRYICNDFGDLVEVAA